MSIIITDARNNLLPINLNGKKSPSDISFNLQIIDATLTPSSGLEDILSS